MRHFDILKDVTAEVFNSKGDGCLSYFELETGLV